MSGPEGKISQLDIRTWSKLHRTTASKISIILIEHFICENKLDNCATQCCFYKCIHAQFWMTLPDWIEKRVEHYDGLSIKHEIRFGFVRYSTLNIHELLNRNKKIFQLSKLQSRGWKLSIVFGKAQFVLCYCCTESNSRWQVSLAKCESTTLTSSRNVLRTVDITIPGLCLCSVRWTLTTVCARCSTRNYLNWRKTSGDDSLTKITIIVMT